MGLGGWLAATVGWRAAFPILGLPGLPGTYNCRTCHDNQNPKILPFQPATRAAADKDARLEVPLRAIVRRAEMTGLYVVGPDGRPLLRQVRLGRSNGNNIEILSGVAAGERVALDPQAAARIR